MTTNVKEFGVFKPRHVIKLPLFMCSVVFAFDLIPNEIQKNFKLPSKIQNVMERLTMNEQMIE